MKLSVLRKSQGYTLREFVHTTGIPAGRYAQIETGRVVATQAEKNAIESIVGPFEQESYDPNGVDLLPLIISKKLGSQLANAGVKDNESFFRYIES